jgi:hypothetical protein
MNSGTAPDHRAEPMPTAEPTAPAQRPGGGVKGPDARGSPEEGSIHLISTRSPLPLHFPAACRARTTGRPPLGTRNSGQSSGPSSRTVAIVWNSARHQAAHMEARGRGPIRTHGPGVGDVAARSCASSSRSKLGWAGSRRIARPTPPLPGARDCDRSTSSYRASATRWVRCWARSRTRAWTRAGR